MSDKAEVTNKTNTSDTSSHEESGDITLIPGEKTSFDEKASSADNNRTTSPFSLENLANITDISKRWPLTGSGVKRTVGYFAR